MKTEKTLREKIADKLYWIIRLGILAVSILMFFPAFNAARICSTVNKNMSLFTSAVSWDGLKQDVGTAFRFGILNEDTYRLIMVAAFISVVGIVIMAAGGCMSLGNTKMKKISNIPSAVGSVVLLGGMIFTEVIRNKLFTEVSAYDAAHKGSEKVAEYGFTLPYGTYVFGIIAAVVLLFTIVAVFALPKVEKGARMEMETKFKLFLIMLPFIALVLIFSYLPLYGWRYAFFNYKPGTELTSENFVGWFWFKYLFQDAQTRADVIKVLRNTLIMSGLGIATSWVPMAFAIFFNEIKAKWVRKGVQVITTVPNFISWVMVYTIAFAIFSTQGFINKLTGGTTNYLLNPDGTWFKMLLWGMWKGTGWSAIVYIAGITGIDPQLYEAATVDGAGRFQKMWHVTLPGLLPTYCVLLLMQIANILTNGMDQYLVFRNENNADLITVLDLYVYKLGLEGQNTIPLSTVASMFKSVVSVILLFSANGISKLIRGESIM